jgi:hypothetical protein
MIAGALQYDYKALRITRADVPYPVQPKNHTIFRTELDSGLHAIDIDWSGYICYPSTRVSRVFEQG